MDYSHLDKNYFFYNDIYNCPFCNRKHVKFSKVGFQDFHWTIDKVCVCFSIKCDSCKSVSVHFTFNYKLGAYLGGKIYDSNGNALFPKVEKFFDDIDSYIFHSIPSSFFTTDSRIPNIFRELIEESEGCLKNNFLTGASVCIRKIIYELARKEKAEGNNYNERIKSLKSKIKIEPIYFDNLLTIQEVTSDKVHEESYDGWEAKHIRFCLMNILKILKEIYVVPAIREENRQELLNFKKEILDSKKSKPH